MAYRKKMSRGKNKRSFRRGLKSRGKNYTSGFTKRGGMRF